MEEGTSFKQILVSNKERVTSSLQQHADMGTEKTKSMWTEEEDQALFQLVRKYGTKAWASIAVHLPGRSGKQIRDRYQNQIDPTVCKESWTPDEDAIFIQAHKKLNNRWSEIAKLLPGRTCNAIKNHWNSSLKRQVQDSQVQFTQPVKHTAVLTCRPRTLCDRNLPRFDIDCITLQSGQVLHNAWIHYATWGRLNDDGSNCVLFPTHFNGTHIDNASIIGSDHALNPSRWFIVVPNMLGNGLSISPSNASQCKGSNFPKVSVYDNVMCQKLLLDHLGVKKIKLVLGWSVGALQAWHWAALHADMVENLLSICGASRCWPYNQAILHGIRAAIHADPAFEDGLYSTPPVDGLQSFGRACMPWAYSAAFFREERFREIGFASVEELEKAWELDHVQYDANNVITSLQTWQDADVSVHAAFEGNLSRALGSIKARCIVMPCDRDQLYTAEENSIEVALTPRAELRTIVSSAGNAAGAPGVFKEEGQAVEAAIAELLADEAGPSPIAASGGSGRPHRRE